jgi:thioredoxin 1
MNGITNVTAENFSEEVLAANELVVVDFWADWCQPCKMLNPVIERTAAQFEGRARFVKCDVDANPQLAQQYGALRIPNLLFFKNGEVVEQSVGVVSDAQLAAKVSATL